MEQNPIRFELPTSRAFSKMKRVLFQPFDIGKWFALGFSAWLAGLFNQGGGNGGSYSSSSGNGSEETEGGTAAEPTEVINDFLEGLQEWAQGHLAIVIGIGVLILLLIGVIVALLWVSSRGKFMFLDNVVHNRALVRLPWTQFRKTGNSLFWWQLTWGAFVILVLLLIAGSLAFLIFTGIQGEMWAGNVIAGSIGLGLALLTTFLITGYIWMLLEDFVIPLMYKNSISTNQAWSCLFQIHRSSMGSFVLYFLWKLLLTIVSLTGIFALGLGTCCIGFLLMAIPYIGAVVLLPVSVFFRFLGPEFLRQFGPEFDIFTVPIEPPRNTPAI